MAEEFHRGERGPAGDKGYHGQRGEKGATGEQGVKGEKGEPEPIHPLRWRALAVWIILFTSITFYALQQIRNQSATLHQLQKTNCGLRNFLLTAEKARLNTASHETGIKKQQDLDAADGYGRLAANFTQVGNCQFHFSGGVG